MAARLRRASTAEQLEEALRSEILGGDLPPGERLREIEMAERYGVSRNTLREALHGLVRRGLVDHRPHRGAAVARPEPGQVREIFRVRRALEPAALDLVSPERLSALGGTAAELESAAAAADWPRVADLDVRFHAELVGALDSPRLDAFFLSLLQTLRLAFIAVDRASARRAPPDHVAEHGRIVRTVAGGRRTPARRLLAAHLDAAEALLLAGLPAEDA